MAHICSGFCAALRLVTVVVTFRLRWCCRVPVVAQGTSEQDVESARASTHAASWLAWSLAGLCLVMAVATTVLSVLPRPIPRGSGDWSSAGDLLVFVTFLAFPIVGALTASRRPRNRVGWICLTAGLLWWLILVSGDYSAYGLTMPGSVPFPVTVYALLYAWLWVPAVGLLGIYMILLFPDGKLPSRRWRPLVWFSGAVIAVESVAVFLTPGPLDGLGGARNPFGLEGAAWLTVLGYVVLPLLPLCMLASAASLMMRFRRSGGEVRQQIKWIALAASFMGALYLTIMGASFIDWLISAPGAQSDMGTQTWWGALLEDVMVLSFTAIPIAIGVAILRYRLYEIDIIINRALVYGSLTTTLVALYFGGVVLLQQLFVLLTGQRSTLAVVASTLLIAALFNPLRRGLQSFVDRRFYRRKYDARKTLETFSARWRDEADLDALTEDLVGVVAETMQPAHVSLWLRPDKASKRSRGE